MDYQITINQFQQSCNPVVLRALHVKKFIDRINFNINLFKTALQEKLKHQENDTYSAFSSAFTNYLNTHAPFQTETLR